MRAYWCVAPLLAHLMGCDPAGEVHDRPEDGGRRDGPDQTGASEAVDARVDGADEPPPPGLCPENACALNWSIELAERPGPLAAGPDGSVYFLSDGEIVRYARDGTRSEITPRAAAAGRLLVARDGTFFVARTQQLEQEERSVVEVMHIDAAGELIDTGRWDQHGSESASSVYNDTRLVDMKEDQATGIVHLLVTVSLEGMRVGHLQDGTVVTDYGPWGERDFGAMENASASTLAFAPDDHLAIGAGGANAMVLVASAGTPSRMFSLDTAPDDDFDEGTVHGLISDGSGGWYVAYAEGHFGWSFTVDLLRVAPDGRSLWTSRASLDDDLLRGPTHHGPPNMHLGALSESMLLAIAPTPMGEAPLNRWAPDGSRLTSVDLGEEVVDLITTGSLSAALVTTASSRAGADASYRLLQLSFPLVVPERAGRGARCTIHDACQSALCCVAAASGEGQCSDVPCSVDALCDTAEQCESGLCHSSGDGQTGYCTPACVQSSECPEARFCVDGACRPSCVDDQDCPYPNATCGSANNAEEQSITVCQ